MEIYCVGFLSLPSHLLCVAGINRIYHWSSTQTDKYKPSCQTRVLKPSFSAVPADPRVEISRSASETDD